MASSRHEERSSRTIPSFAVSSAEDGEEGARWQTSERDSRHHHRHHHRHHKPRAEHESSGRRSSHREHRRDDGRPHRRHHDRESSSSGRRQRERERGHESRLEDSSKSRHEDRAKGDRSAGSDSVLFATDTRGDPLIWQFGANDRRRVPLYYRYGDGRFVLGADKRFTFSHEGAQELFSIALPSGGGTPVFRDKSHPLLVRAMAASSSSASRPRAASKAEAPKTSADSSSDRFASDFVPLHASHKRKRGSISSGSSESDNESCRSSASTSSSSSSSSDDGDDVDVEDKNKGIDDFVMTDPALESLKQKMVDVSRRVKEQPGDVNAWLELVDLQDQQRRLLGNSELASGEAAAGGIGRGAPSRDEITGVAKVKLSMLESALKSATSVADRERLQLAAMRESAKTCTPKQLAQRWQELGAGSPGGALSFALWKARLDFEMTSLSTFTVDRLRAFFEDRMRYLKHEVEALQQQQEEEGSLDARLSELYAQMVYVFLRATRFLYDAGFSNIATAAWQALLESLFARPPQAEVPAGADLAAFWDSELPRLGEDGAQGWRCFAAAVASGKDADSLLLERDGQAQVQAQVLPTIDLAGIVDSAYSTTNAADRLDRPLGIDEQMPLYEAWVAVERRRAALAKLPARLADDFDDGGYDDVFRTVVFSDIESLLFAVPPSLSSLVGALQPLLIDAFLLFCQLPPAFAASPWIETARSDPFLAIVYLGTGIFSSAYGGSDEGNSRHGNGDYSAAAVSSRSPPDFAYDGSRMAASPELLFSQPAWFRCLPDWLRQSQASAAEAPVPPRWVANTLRQLVRSFGVEALSSYSLAVDAAVKPDGVKKAARALLKQYLSNTALYNAYALAELSRGRGDIARSVLSSAVKATAAASPPDADAEAEMSLRQTWAWIELDAGRKNAAFRRLLPTAAAVAGADDGADAAPDHLDDDDCPISPSQLLRARHALRTEMDYSLSMGHINRAVTFAESFVLSEFLCSTEQPQLQPRPGDKPAAAGGTARASFRQGNLAAALAASAAFSDEMLARGHGKTVAHERLLQWTARILFFHASNGPYRPVDLQAPLHRFVSLFPRNGIFLRLFAWIDPASASGLSRLRPDDPVRQILDTVVLTRDHDCPSNRAFAIRHAGGSNASGDAHAARAALERALEGASSACQGSAQLWLAYVHLTAVAAMGARRSRGRLDRKVVARAKDAYYRAVRACPGSKDVLLEAFGPGTALVAASDAAMTPSELRAVFNTIVSKGLHVHVDLTLALQRAGLLAEERRGGGQERYRDDSAGH